jgi:hypothetical protein
MEQAKGIGGNNIVTVLMKNRGMDLQTACDHVGEYCEELVHEYLAAMKSLPSYGSPDLDDAVARYAEACGHWIKGNLE